MGHLSLVGCALPGLGEVVLRGLARAVFRIARTSRSRSVEGAPAARRRVAAGLLRYEPAGIVPSVSISHEICPPLRGFHVARNGRLRRH